MKILTKYGFVLIALLILLGTVVAVSLWLEEKSPADCLVVQISCADKEEVISAWSNENDELFFFLPAYADLRSARIVADTQFPIRLNRNNLENGMSCTEFKLNVPYTLTYTTWGGESETTLTFLQADNLATMYIDTQSGDMEYIHGNKGNEEEAEVRIYGPDGVVDYSGKVKSLAGRGNSTWNEYEKKPYNLKLADSGNLLGMGAAVNWVLLANASDASNMRNKIVYDFAANVGMQYVPNSQWVVLYLNGEYAGLYLLSEKNEIHPERINIESENSFLVSQEVEERLQSNNDPYIKTQNGQILRIRETSIALDEIKTIWQSSENAILNEDGYDEVTGKAWNELIDVDSWVQKFLIEEVFGNIDAGYCSQFFYFDKSTSQICAGPVWDYDYSMYETDAFFALRDQAKVGIFTPWYPSLFEKPLFKSYVKKLYEDEYVALANKLIAEDIDNYAQTINNAAIMDGIRWGLDPDSFQTAVKNIKESLSGRISFLSSVWIDEENYCYVQVDKGLGGNIIIHAVKPGGNLEQILSEVTNSGDAPLGWYNAETNERIDIRDPINGDMVIYADWAGGLKCYLQELLPIGAITVAFLCLFGADVLYNKKRRRK